MVETKRSFPRLRALLVAALSVGAVGLFVTACSIVPGLMSPTTTPTATAMPTQTSTPTATPTATATSTRVPLSMSIEISPTVVPQGGIGLLHVQTNRPVSLTASLQGRPLPLYQENGQWYGLVGVFAGTPTTTWPMVITATDTLGGPTIVAQKEMRITAREFTLDEVILTQETLGLLSDATAVQKEADMVTALVTPRTPIRLWSGPFLQPVQGEVTTTYGQRRSYNGSPAGEYHGGIDLGIDEGTPVLATNTGKVVFAGLTSVRGNLVIVDHGWGLYSGYFHMSAIKVQVGQTVKRGDTIGLVGTTGLSTGPHLHWQIWLGGNPVDPNSLLQWQLVQ
jgi:murein DD-endopeptidase MepM/ murein hydrolase activator NlpD